MTGVDLIIPTYNGSAMLARCLRSLRGSTITDFNLIVFDDGSTEDIAAVVTSLWPRGEVLRVEQNVGLARGFNLAIARGTAAYVVLLNNDTIVEPDWLAELVACAERHPEAGSIASKLRLAADIRKLHSAGDYYSVRGVPGSRGVWMDDLGQFDDEAPIFGACGGAALYRRAALEAVKLPSGQIFDERLFMYCEDVDLAWRLQRAGWPCWFAWRAVVYHELSATGGGAFASYWVARNLWLVLARSVPSGLLRPYRARVTACHLGRLARTLLRPREPAARAALRGTAVGLMLAALERDRPGQLTDSEAARLRQLLRDPR